MADYAADIVVANYLYRQAITLTEQSGEDQTNLTVRLDLNSTNFNFDFARSDGLDFRLAETAAGSKIYNMFIGVWDEPNKDATMWFKVPFLSANEVKTLYAYWGNPSDTGISDGDSIGLLLFDHFPGVALDGSKWTSSGPITVANSKLSMAAGSYIQAKNVPLTGTYQWMLQDAFYITDASPSVGYASGLYRFYGGDNLLGINFYGEGANDRYHNFVQSGSYVWDDGDQRGLEGSSYHELTLTYHEPTDYITQGFERRSTYPDYLDSWERKCEGNTRLTYFRIYGPNTYGSTMYHDWVMLRRYLGPYEPVFDTSNLYVQYEQVNPDAWVYDYGVDITNTIFDHTTTSGGTPTYLSDDSLINIWCSDVGAASGNVDLTIDFGAYGNNLVDDAYLHYDSDHVLHLNAASLSDEDFDLYNNTYWHGTTTSGWATIDFGSRINNVGVVRVKGVSSKLSGMVKNYKIEGSYVYTNNWEDDNWKVLDEGQFGQTDAWQSTLFANYNNYRFYRLKVVDTYGGNIAIQEWRMYNYDDSLGKRVVSRLKLKPDATNSNFIYFPKQIEFYGSNDSYNWTTLISTKNTYTPTDGAWQEHAFTNNMPYYVYRLRCIGNWNNNIGKICIAEWSMHERYIEATSHRILAGTNDNYIAIWGDVGSTFDELEFYVVNDKISFVENEKLVGTKTFTGSPTDLNVK